MKRMKVIDLFNVPYAEMSNRIDDVLSELQKQEKKILDFKVIGESLNKCAVFVMYEEE